ncbi:UNVERIFIED_CONTAM: LINE-1 retrotransposable element O protein [Sesamum radiatum]|uniref:LINE-1 retrotransposable element O protein n=1 Tax=Sesamum radiatum TaxID=300843 RepID=A0AAW2U629_SESRA
MQLFPDVSVTHLPVNCSDHKALLLRLSDAQVFVRQNSRPWRFEAAWLQSDQCEQVVAKSWGRFLGCNRDTGVARQIEACQSSLSQWSKSVFHKQQKRGHLLEEKMARLLGKQVTPEVNAEIDLVRQELERCAAYEETVWRQRCKELWLREGDRNTGYFHRRASQRFKVNSIRKIREPSGQWVVSEEGIQRCIEAHFREVYASSRPLQEHIAAGTEHLHRVVDASMVEDLLTPYTALEVSKALFQMAPQKSPGPDGMSPIFFQKFWHIVGTDVLSCVLNLLNSFIMPPGLNSTHIVLIPKCKHPEYLTQFRPISLCNVIYKIASKTIANRLKPLLDCIFSHAQAAFVPGRLIFDNILLVFELNHFLNTKTKGGSGWMALKLDVSKAYDKVEWSFLEQVLFKLGFLHLSFV